MDVHAASQRIKAISDNDNTIQKRSQPTHFICIKITDPTIKLNYSNFKDDILSSKQITDTQKKSFMRLEKLHITFNAMTLTDAEDRLRAEQVLIDCVEKIIKPIKSEYGNVAFMAQGLELMKGYPTNARVLYSKIESESVQKIANAVKRSFHEAGFGNPGDVKLHMTLMNIKYAQSKARKPRSFDASHILEKFNDLQLGQQEVDQILLVKMKGKDADGFYKCIAKVEF